MKNIEIYLEVPDSVDALTLSVGILCKVCGKTWGIKLHNKWGIWSSCGRQLICRVCEEKDSQHETS